METEMRQYDKKAEESNNYHLSGQRIEDHIKREMMNLKQRADREQGEYLEQVSQMQSAIEEDKKAQNSAIKDIAKMVPKGGTGESLDHVLLLKFLNEKWENEVKDQKRVLDTYNRNIKILHDSFA
jgi:hypothetical protein